MMEYPWPGNVRELERVVQRAMILSPSPHISADELNIGSRASHSGLRMAESFQKAKNRTIQAFELSYLTELLRTRYQPHGLSASTNTSPAYVELRLLCRGRGCGAFAA